MRMTIRIMATALLGIGLGYGASWAEERAPQEVRTDAIGTIMSAVRIEALMQVVATEGARHGMSLEKALFAGQGGRDWARVVSAIQTPERLVPIIASALRTQLSPADAEAVAAFYSGDLGGRIVMREVEARRDMLDGAVETGASEAAALAALGTDRAMLIDEIIDGMDLVDSNVSGGLNANFAFYRGLGDGGALHRRMTESEMIAMVWNQESAVRTATAKWLRGYLTLAYAPFSDAELRTYMSFTQTPAGRRYLAAMFAGFGEVFETTSYDLGIAAARFIVQDTI